MSKIIYILVAIAVVMAGVSFWFAQKASMPVEPLPVEEGVMCTMDAMQCPDGSYVGRTGPTCEFVCPALPAVPAAVQASIDAHADMIILTTPVPLGLVENGLVVTGQARGNWFFEASFVVDLVSSTGTVIARSIATTTSDWMTTDFIPFTTSLQFVNPYSEGADESLKNGMLILRKENPSGDPVRDDSLEIPVRFAL